MQHKVISYSAACELIEQLGAIEVHSAGWAQTFRAENNGSQSTFNFPERGTVW